MEELKVNYSFKKFLNKQHTSNDKEWYEEDDGFVLKIHSNEVWIDSKPENPTTVDYIKKINGLKMVMDKTVQNRKAYYMVDENGQRITSLIPPVYGNIYNAKITINNHKIPTSHSSKPMFDYVNGILTFENTPPKGNVYISCYQYVGKILTNFIDEYNNSVSVGVLGLNEPKKSYLIQHNLNSFNIHIDIYLYEKIGDKFYWKKDVVPLIILNENVVKIELSEEKTVRFVIKAYNSKLNL